MPVYTPARPVWTLIVCNYSKQLTSDRSGHRQSGRGEVMNRPIVFTCCRWMLLSLIRPSEWYFIFSFPLPMSTTIRNPENTQRLPRSKHFPVSGTLFSEFGSLEWLRFHSKRLCRRKEKSTVTDRKLGF